MSSTTGSMPNSPLPPTSHLLWYPGHELLVPDIVRAEGCHLYDSRGKKYVDLESGVWCTSVGHAHPRVLRVLAEQAARFAHAGFNYSGAVVEESAQEFLSLTGLDGGKCVFLCSGSEAIEYGVRVARMVSDRSLFLTMTDSYFGAYGSAHAREQDQWFTFDWFPREGCAHDGAAPCEHLDEIPFDRIGGFLLEPGSSSGFVRFPPEKLIRNIVRNVRENGGLILVNEVTTGIGRTGKWFGYQHYDFTPDVVAMGKGVGNGYPVSVAAFASGVVERLGDRDVPYAQSHQNDPLGAAVACEVIRIIREEGLIERSLGLANLLRSGLEGVRDRTGRISAIRSRGFMFALDLTDEPDGSFAVDLTDDSAGSFTQRVHRELMDRGYVVCRRPGANPLRIDPSLTVAHADIEGFLAVLEEVLAGA